MSASAVCIVHYCTRKTLTRLTRLRAQARGKANNSRPPPITATPSGPPRSRHDRRTACHECAPASPPQTTCACSCPYAEGLACLNAEGPISRRSNRKSRSSLWRGDLNTKDCISKLNTTAPHPPASARWLEDLPRGQQLLPQDSGRHVLNGQLSRGGQGGGDPRALPERHPRELQTY